MSLIEKAARQEQSCASRGSGIAVLSAAKALLGIAWQGQRLTGPR